MSEQRNPWTRQFWNLTEQGRFLQKHGLERARAAATEAGLDPDRQPGLREEQKLSPLLNLHNVDAIGFADIFNKENAKKFEATVAAHKPPAPPKGGLDYSGYMRRKKAKQLAGRG
ncbi:MAG TPA: hypothetical protein VFV58_24040 [Blastocatellia bacterium]|jgi:hypothetical protein|nr:hypothetical protein [Blastocatellia bacterium]